MKDTKFTIPTKATVYNTANVEINPIDFINSMRKAYGIEDIESYLPIDCRGYKQHYSTSNVHILSKAEKTNTHDIPRLVRQNYYIETDCAGTVINEERKGYKFTITDDPKIISLFEALNALETAINNLNNK